MVSRSRFGIFVAIALVALAATLLAPSGSSAQSADAPSHHDGTSCATHGVADVPTPETTSALRIDVVASNDAGGTATLRYALPRAGMVRITLMTVDGKEVGVLASGLSSAGENRLEIETDAMPIGEYRIVLQTRDGNVSTRLVVVR